MTKRKLTFEKIIDTLPVLLQQLKTSKAYSASKATSDRDFPSTGGIYVFYEHKRALYVGRTNNLKRRLQLHKTSDAMGASLAYKIARMEAEVQKLDLSGAKNKAQRMRISEFKSLFIAAKKRIKEMSVRIVTVEDSVTQHLLEPYIHLKLKTPLNDFDTH